jgi:hypothetical protein
VGVSGISAKFAPSKSPSLAKLPLSEVFCPEVGNARSSKTAEHDIE